MKELILKINILREHLFSVLPNRIRVCALQRVFCITAHRILRKLRYAMANLDHNYRVGVT